MGHNSSPLVNDPKPERTPLYALKRGPPLCSLPHLLSRTTPINIRLAQPVRKPQSRTTLYDHGSTKRSSCSSTRPCPKANVPSQRPSRPRRGLAFRTRRFALRRRSLSLEYSRLRPNQHRSFRSWCPRRIQLFHHVQSTRSLGSRFLVDAFRSGIQRTIYP